MKGRKKVKQQLKKLKQKGFTLIEIIVVIAILGIMTLISVPKMLGYTSDANLVKMKSDIKAYEQAATVALMQDPSLEEKMRKLPSEEVSTLNNSQKVIDKEGFGVEMEGEENFEIELQGFSTRLRGMFIWTSDNSVVYYDESIEPQPIKYKDGSIKDTNGEVHYPNGDILMPNGDLHLKDGTIIKENGDTYYADGTIKFPTGEIVYPDGRIKYPNGELQYPNGDVLYPDGTLKDKDGNIKNEDGSLTTPNGDILYSNGDILYANGDLHKANGEIHYADGSIKYPNGEIHYANGDIKLANGDIKKPNGDLHKANGEIHYANGDIKLTNGDLKKTNGDIVKPNGDVHKTNGEIHYANGDIKKTDGTIAHKDGSTTRADGLRLHTDGSVTLKDGTYVPIADPDKDFDHSLRYIGTAKKVVVPSVINGAPRTTMNSMFAGTNVEVVVSMNPNVTTTLAMFSGSTAPSLQVHIESANITNMSQMFARTAATSIKGLDTLKTSKVTDMTAMFQTSKATNIDVSKFSTANVKDFSNMFENTVATHSLNVKHFNVSKATYLTGMFANSAFSSIDVSGWTPAATSSFGSLQGMFEDAKATSIKLDNMLVPSITNFADMFEGTKAISLDLSSFAFKSNASVSDIFLDSSAKTILVKDASAKSRLQTSIPSGATISIK